MAENLEFRRDLRKASTDAELRLWRHLRAHRFSDLKFRRQHPIGPYMVDFYCHAKLLVIELDGSQHYEVLRDILGYTAAEIDGLEAANIIGTEYGKGADVD